MRMGTIMIFDEAILEKSIAELQLIMPFLDKTHKDRSEEGITGQNYLIYQTWLTSRNVIKVSSSQLHLPDLKTCLQ